MNRFLKINSPWLSLLALAVFIVVLAFLFRPKSSEYQINANSTLKLFNDQSNQVQLQNIAGKQLIDIRTADLFAQGHPQNAINIPARQLLEKESIEMLNQISENGKEAVLYGSDELQATAPWLLLQQMGYKNLLLFKGGIAANGELVDSKSPATEVSVIDMSAIRSKVTGLSTTATKVETKKPEVIIPVRKAASSGGGC
ncbi:MAG: rhodanese-like domain-containing protein [Bacteroidetes bacterium]|nr:rhodanese-like domain-containing protein [Bacteroidota bacterium]